VKRRIILGTYALSSGYYDAFYGSAQKVRRLIADDFDAAFAQVDVLVSPSTPTPRSGWGSGSTIRWRCTSRTCAPSPPTWRATRRVPSRRGWRPRTGLPVGFQVMAPPLADDRVYRVGAALERALAARDGGVLTDRIAARWVPQTQEA
jgi:aspartyl-tRNA(Asn)/glutamyl-tRNA(Gln) amidotransferase subunit A